MRVGGFDLSLRSSGMVAVPKRWFSNGVPDWTQVRSKTVGYGLPKDASEPVRLERIRTIRNAARDFVAEHDITVAVVEQYAFSASTAGAHALGELGGVVKLALLEAGVEVIVVSPAPARKLLGKIPRAGAKEWAASRLYSAGAPKAWGLDVTDAFVMANHHLSENGGDALVLPAEAACA